MLTTGETIALPSPPSGPTPRLVPPVGMPRLEVGGDGVEVCPAGRACTEIFAESPVDAGLGMHAAVNEPGSLVALSSVGWIETSGLATQKRIAKFKTGPKESPCNWIEWAGDTLVITELRCGKASGTAWLATKTGKKIGMVGGAKPLEIAAMTRVKGSLWAFN